MPIDPSILGAVAGGSNIVDTGLNAVLQQKQNKANQRYATYMYDRQRADALADFDMQNKYNAPSAQMERLKAAKLNPNLIYGTGTQAAGLSSPVRSSSAPSYKGEAPQINLGGAMGAFIDAMMKQTQMNTMETVQRVNEKRLAEMDATIGLKNSQSKLAGITTAAKGFKLGVDKSLVGVTVDTARQKLDNLKAQRDLIVTDTFYKMHEDIRRTMLANTTNKEKLQHIALMVAQEAATKEGTSLTSERMKEIAQNINNMEKNGELIDLEKQLKNGELDLQYIKGLMPHILWGTK
ncbi:DNA pilot protein [Blackfly microvirus SF02]|uniref:DNA pilot protein n=1 Tax=Blackfly microvirus SF02 TaxID=2576452 RepID=A0A4P8PSL6_9VIRU|nr:DNA pilot protein [Blackfly microvirus SF02]